MSPDPITFISTHKLLCNIIIIFAGYSILLLTSGKVLMFILSKVKSEKQDQKNSENTSNENKESKNNPLADKKALDTGKIIGKCENILILSLVLAQAYTALALIFAAKTIIREEEIKNNSLYFLAGTMINVTYSILVGLILNFIILQIKLLPVS
jgi:hypothetical protein